MPDDIHSLVCPAPPPEPPIVAGLTIREILILKTLSDQQALHRNGLLDHAVAGWTAAGRQEARAGRAELRLATQQIEIANLHARIATLEDLLARHGHGDPERYG
jgi:hypothetical protein